MREILFQGKEIKNNDSYSDNYESQGWIVGLPCSDPDDNDKIKFIDNLVFNKIEVIPESVGEYTGVRDSQSVRIFEHDIVKLNPDSELEYVVEYDDDSCSFVLATKENKTIKFPLHSWLARECTIVGNLFDEEVELVINEKLVKLPEVGKTYAFFDDGKSDYSRRHKAEVIAIFTVEEIQNNDANLYAAWLDNKEHHDWLFAEMTDYFIKCDIPSYDKNPVWFVRTHEGGWFSIDYPNYWMGGCLDVDGSKCKQIGLPPVDQWEFCVHWGSF